MAVSPVDVAGRVARLMPQRFKKWMERRRAIAEGHAHPLSMTRVGQEMRVAGIVGDGIIQVEQCFECAQLLSTNHRRRLMEMGITPGAKLSVIRTGNPVLMTLRDTRIAVGADLARCIFVVDPSVKATGKAPEYGCTCCN